MVNVLFFALTTLHIFIYRNILAKDCQSYQHQSLTTDIKLIISFLIFAFISIIIGESKELIVDLAYFSSLPFGCYIIFIFSKEISKDDFMDSFNFIFKGLTVVILFAVAFISPSTGEDRLSSATLHANTIGEYSSFVIIHSIFMIFILNKKGIKIYIPIFIASLALIKAFSKTSILTTLILIVVILLISFIIHKKLYIKTISFIIFFVISLASQGSLFISKYAEYTSNDKNMETLSGRTVIWAAAFEKIPDKLFLGHGWRSTNDVFGFFFKTFELPHCHNEYVNLLFEVGLIGTILLVIVQIRTVYKLFYWSFFKKNFILLNFLFFLLLIISRSYTEISFSHGGMRFFVLYAAIIFLNYEPEQKDTNNESIDSYPIV